MDDAPFALSEQNRQLLAAGVRYFLCDGPPVPPRRQRAAQTPPGLQESMPDGSGRRGENFEKASGPRDASVFLAKHSGGAPDIDAAQAKRLLGEAPWKDFAARLPAAPRTIWTYDAYASDVLSQDVPKTRELWQTVIRSLNAPRGTIGFFPFSLGQGQDRRKYPEVFFGLVETLRPHCVIAYGEEAFQTLVGCAEAHQYGFMPGIALHKAPSPEELLRFAPEELHLFIRKLSSLLFA